MQAKAAVMPVRHGRWSIETVAVAEPGPNEVLVRVVASGICQTDVHARDGFFPIPCPAGYGHEGAGIVARVGAEVTTLTGSGADEASVGRHVDLPLRGGEQLDDLRGDQPRCQVPPGHR